MPWFRSEDGLSSSKKVTRIPRSRRAAAMGLWILAGTWCSRELTDGFVASHMVEELCGTEEMVSDLVMAGLWDRDDERDGYQFVNYGRYQPLKEAVEAEREEARKRMQKVRAARRGGRPEHGSTETQGGSPGVRANTSERQAQFALPDPTRVPTEQANTRSPDAETLPIDGVTPDGATDIHSKRTLDDHFDQFWAAYPNKVAKKDARKAWDRARKDTPVADILAGALRYATECRGKESKFVKHPGPWLNGGRWADEPGSDNATAEYDAAGNLTAASVEAILGRDLWSLPDPPSGIEPGTRAFIEWARTTTAEHYAERRAQATARLQERNAS